MSLHGSTVADAATWHTTRPWAPPLSLIVREITSVSATFILSFSVPDLNRDVASLLQSAEDDNDLDSSNGHDGGSRNSRKRPSFISEILAKGLFSINVNGASWQRILIRVAESGDEAIIIVYGLFPGRQYDIDLGLVQGGQSSTVRSHFTTEDRDHQVALDTHIESELTALDSVSASPTSDRSRRDSSQSSSFSASSSTSFSTNTGSSRTSHNSSARSASPSASSDAPSASTLPDPAEEHVNQLQQALNALKMEEETLAANLKAVRRESQKADAALRAEIEVMKRASEKHAAAEQRAKQKILALQEAQKRAVAAAQETEEELRKVEASLPDLIKERERKEKEHEKVEAEARKVRKEREQLEEAERKQLESMNAELAALQHKLEKLRGKKDKLETSTIPDLEGQLREVTEEIEAIEAEEREIERTHNAHHIKMSVDEMGILQPPAQSTTDSLIPNPQPRRRSRDNSLRAGAPSGFAGNQPALAASQLSVNMQAPSTHPHMYHQAHPSWNVGSPRPSQPQRQQPSPRTPTYPPLNALSNPRSQAQQPPIILSNPQRKPTISKHVTSPSFHALHNPSSNTPPSSASHSTLIKPSSYLTTPPRSPPTMSEPTQISSIASSSTLSSSAPAFEPGLGAGIWSKGVAPHQRSAHPSASTSASSPSGQGTAQRPAGPSFPSRS